MAFGLGRLAVLESKLDIYEDLSKDEWMRKLKNEDLEQLKQVMEFDTCSKK